MQVLFFVCLTASLLVGAIGAVGVVVAHPGQRDALAGAAAAGELLRRALLDICEWHFSGRGRCRIGFLGGRVRVRVEQRGKRRMRISETTKVNLLQSRSSAPSTQSIWPSQCQAWEIQVPGVHSNWPRAHFPVPVFRQQWAYV